MHLVARQAVPSDYVWVKQLYEDRGFPAPSESSWNHLWTDGGAFGAALENCEEQPSRRCAGFIAGIYVSDAVFAELCAKNPTEVCEWLQSIGATGRAPFLVENAIARANGGAGLNLLLTHLVWRAHDREPSHEYSLRALLHNAFADRHSGNNLKALALPATSTTAAEAAERLGFSPCRNRFQEQAPYYTIEREKGLRSGDCWLGRMFTYYSPVFQFTAPQREILMLAREGYTDSEIAQMIGIKPDAVKKRWISIYPRVMRILPDLLPNAGSSGRGAEKRRVLLMHLQDRPEELQPFQRAGKASARR